MGRHIIGATPDELRGAREIMRKMLRENGPPPEGRFEDAAVLAPARDYKARHASILLVFDAVDGSAGQDREEQAAGENGVNDPDQCIYSGNA